MDMTDAVQHHLDIFAEHIGPRMIGTPGNVDAARYIETVFNQAKLEVHRQQYACPSWKAEKCKLRVGDQTVDAVPNTFTPSCSVTGTLVMVRTLRELEVVEANRAILILCGELTADPIMDLVDHAIYLPDRDRKIGLLLREKQPQAIITISLAPEYTPILLEDRRLNIPSVTISAETGLLLARNVGSNATLEISSDTSSGQTANVIGRNLSPTGSKRVIVCAHYDTKNETSGIWDNGSGVAALLAAAQFYSQQSPPVSIEFVAFSAEEYGIEDSYDDPYLGQFGLSIPPFVYGKEIAAPYKPSGLDDVLAVINFDGIGYSLTANTVAMMACSDELKQVVQGVKDQFNGLVEVGGWPASNHYGFYANGIPSIPISSIGMENIMHSWRDTVDWVSAEQITEVIQFTHELVIQIADKSPEWCRMPRD